MTRIGRPPKSPHDRLMDKVWMCPMSGCWLFVGTANQHGYGIVKADGTHRKIFAHRVSWEKHRGPIPAGLFVCHHCDVPACVNPAHLFLGTAKDNTADMWRKGRGRSGGPGGEDHYAAKLTAEDVDRIRALSLTRPIPELAKQYGLGRSHVWAIARGVKWRKHKSPIQKAAFVAIQQAVKLRGASDSDRWCVIERALQDEAQRYADYIADKVSWQE